MIFLTSGLQDHHEKFPFSLFSGRVEGEAFVPRGTDYLLGRGLHVETETGSRFFSSGYSALSLTIPYRVLGSSDLIRVECGYFRGLNQWTAFEPGQPGRLRYIDGCTNTNLLAPLKNGDPCMNYLFIPPGVEQSAHVHPSARIGMIVGGEGLAVIQRNEVEERLPLREGMKFLLPAHWKHCFHTQGSSLSVLVFHPDSDGGPCDELNPMFTRTYLLGPEARL